MPSGFDWQLIVEWLPSLIKGTITTIWISFFSLLLALTLGLVVSLLRLSHINVVRRTASFYVDLIRGTPALIQILAIYFGLPFFGISIPAIFAGIIALGVNSGAYISEMIRGALESIDPGQMEASRSLGMSYSTSMRRIVIPQIFQVVIPPITGEYNSLVKGSSLLSVISIAELTRVGQRMLGVSFRPVESWLPVAINYFIINYIITRATNHLEKRLAARGKR
jgi:His/Glu/Gln/Arg/opine family amino acid ABC transporter permease subunit